MNESDITERCPANVERAIDNETSFLANLNLGPLAYCEAFPDHKVLLIS